MEDASMMEISAGDGIAWNARRVLKRVTLFWVAGSFVVGLALGLDMVSLLFLVVISGLVGISTPSASEFLSVAANVLESADGTFLRVKIYPWIGEKTLPFSEIHSVKPNLYAGVLRLRVAVTNQRTITECYRRSVFIDFFRSGETFWFIPNENYAQSQLFRQFPHEFEKNLKDGRKFDLVLFAFLGIPWLLMFVALVAAVI